MGRKPVLSGREFTLWGSVFAVLVCFGMACPAAVGAQSKPALRLSPDSVGAVQYTVELTGLGDDVISALERASLSQSQWQRIFPVFTGRFPPDDPVDHPAMLGTYHAGKDLIRFVPRFSFVSNLDYVARFDLPALHGELKKRLHQPAGADILTFSFRLPGGPSQPKTQVSHIYPSSRTLPQNLLKFYIHFNHPMSRGQAYQHIRLVDESGEAVERAFLEIEQELWDGESKRLTLFFDPGRIKRGLRPHQEMGLALIPGRSFRLVIDPSWQDAEGLPLTDGHEKAFRVGPADRTRPDHGAWQVIPPRAFRKGPLRVSFFEALDHALLSRLLIVLDHTGQSLSGAVRIARDEQEWQFIPAQAWRPGTYRLKIPALIEDLAGNTLKSVFDMDVKSDNTGGVLADSIYLDFEVLTETQE